jgi:hypothetical protein
MSKKDNDENYELKSDAVEKLLKAEAGDVPEFSEEELKKYRSKGGIKLPQPLKVILLKAWFAGAVCYFILWGLGMYIYSLIDMLFIMGIVLGMVTDLLTNNVIRFIEATPGENNKWLMFPNQKGMVSFFLNLVYALVLVACVYFLYSGINLMIVAIIGNADTVPLGVEPVLYGVFYMGFDLLFVGCKNLLKQIISDAQA